MTYFPSARAQFAYYRHLGRQTLVRLSPKQLRAVPFPGGNSVATVVKHLHGNMRSRWTDFLTADGEKPWREREAEFEADEVTREEVLARWEEGWATVFAALDEVEADGDLERLVYIRAKGHTVTEATNRQLCHYSAAGPPAPHCFVPRRTNRIARADGAGQRLGVAEHPAWRDRSLQRRELRTGATAGALYESGAEAAGGRSVGPQRTSDCGTGGTYVD